MLLDEFLHLLHFVGGGVAGDDDHCQLRTSAAHLREDFEPVDPRHRDVEEQCVGCRRVDQA